MATLKENILFPCQQENILPSVLLVDCPFIEFPEKHYCLIYPPCCLNGI